MTEVAIVPSENALRSMQPQDVKQLAWFVNQAVETGLFTTSAGGSATRRITSGEGFLMASQGIELGLSPLQSLRELNIISGRVDIPASVRAAKIAASPKVTEWNVESDDTFCTITAKRRDRTNGVKVTIKAESMSQADRNRHRDHMEDWLYARAVRRISRQYFPDLALGMETEGHAVGDTIIDVGRIEREADTVGGYGLCKQCQHQRATLLELKTNTRTGGAFLYCPNCHWSGPPPQAIRDTMRGRKEELTVSPEVVVEYVDNQPVESYRPTPDEVESGDPSEGAGDVGPQPDAIPPAPSLPSDEMIEQAAQYGNVWDAQQERFVPKVEVGGPSRISPDDFSF